MRWVLSPCLCVTGSMDPVTHLPARRERKGAIGFCAGAIGSIPKNMGASMGGIFGARLLNLGGECPVLVPPAPPQGCLAPPAPPQVGGEVGGGLYVSKGYLLNV